MFQYAFKMFLLLFYLGTVISATADDFFGIIDEGEVALGDEKYVKYIVPSGYSPPKDPKPLDYELKDLASEVDEYYALLHLLQKHIESGHAMKGLTFNLYDDNMRETAIALFRLLKVAKHDNLLLIRDWAMRNINKDIADYSFRLLSLYREIDNVTKNIPPFIAKPNYFVNSETINKALKLKINHGKFDEKEGFVNQYYREDNIVTINTNYSGWNIGNIECKYRIDYFREDIGLNSYYYGLHLLYPFWMNNDELSEIDPRYAEQYYFAHKQLLARFNLEQEHLKYTNKTPHEKCYENFIPSLVYENGLPFPRRSNILGKWTNDQFRLKSIDIAIKECLNRGFIYMDNGIKVTLTENNYVDFLSKLIRANYEGPKISKVVKSLFGYGYNGYPVDRYNPAPSVLHHPETTLRDPIYWHLIENLLKYFLDYSETLDPFNLTKYESDDFEIVDNSFTKITTYFDYYKFSLNNIFGGDEYNADKSLVFAARQKRLKHLPFTLNFTVSSLVNKTGNVKLFLGPQCTMDDCWNQYSSFYELDSFPYGFLEGLNYVSWSPDASSRFSFDDHYNIGSRQSKNNKYDLLKFPENMLIPKGTEMGLNFTLFVIIHQQNEMSDTYEPLGFPFHRPARVVEESRYGNFRFYDITIFHKEVRKETKGYFSPHLS